MEKVYQPEKCEEKIYKEWENSGFFNPDKLPKRHKKPYTIFLPPPNITGELHMGHALNATIQDILIRFKRLQGYKTLWLPGTDHAGIATQVKVEKELKKEGKTRFDLGKEKFLEIIWQWKEKYQNLIYQQFKKMGCSLDWSRATFTLDKKYCQAVNFAFFHYYQKGLIYRAERPINWCKRCQTSLSDLEVKYEKEKGKLWYLKYPLKSQNYIVVATTRPETMLGDTAIAVNPKDERYKNLVGEKVILPLVEKEIPIIADYLVDPKFGTGAVKVTPAHDFLDYEISLKHKLSLVKVIDENGKMTGQIPKNYLGLNTFEAREKIIEDLKSKGLLEKTQDYEISLPKCDRCGEKIEVIPSWQWFLRMKDLTKKVEKEIKKGKIKFHPKRFEKILLNWLSNIKDWCISRQIWWGHKIPLEGEEAVLDTWFSSALWPFAPLGWPRKTKDLKRFYPSDVLVTGRDIINIWVARMIFSGLEFMKKIPFKNVIINPTVLTKEGKRMSKSLGTGIDPMILVKKYGADATRFGLCWQLTGVQDIRFLEDNLLMGKKFCNKIWNASRFVIINCQNLKFENPPKVKISNSSLTPKDKKILKSLNNTIKSVTQNLENFNFGKAAQQIYRFFWHDFCDQYIEASKLQISNPKIKNQTLKILLYVLLNSLKILHPFVPFITEEIYQLLPIKNKKRFLMIEEWPYSK